MRHLRPVLAAALAMALGLALTGCMNDTVRNEQPTPTATADFMPGTTNGGDGVSRPTASADPIILGDDDANSSNPGNTANSSNGALAPFDWANGAAQIERAIAGISEIADSRVVVTNTTALVGVKFDNAYKGQLTERIRQMVAAEVMRADPNIQTVAVTSDAGDVEKVYKLSDDIRAGRTADELAPEINSIVRNATTMR
ncbi:MAG: YhcN/YlaJ family sporulation lipoprotein [Clostridia bacterium]|nr:YhcN/YlaJ family sporulation lipoprotein [Clostridia bacterium]